MAGFVELETRDEQKVHADKKTRISKTMQQLIQKERWPGEYVGGQRVQCVPLVTPGQYVPANQPVLRLERPNSSTSLELSGNERRSEVAPAGLEGRVLAITPRGGVLIESIVHRVPGVLGVGNQVAGVLTTLHVHDESGISGEMSKLPTGAILAIPEPLTFTVLRRAVISGVTGIISGSISLGDLEGFLHTDLLSLLQSTNIEQEQAHLPAITLMLTEGIGQRPMEAATFELLQQQQGAIVLVSGMTSTRYHLVPELLVSTSQQEMQEYVSKQEVDAARTHQSPGVGTRVRVVCGMQEGAVGQIEYIFMHEQLFPSGVMSRAVRLRLESGTSIMVPLIHVQSIEHV